MKVYFIYIAIPSNIFDGRIKYLMSNAADFRHKNQVMFGLYCWTTKKKLVNEFFEVRENKAYTLVPKELDEESLKKLKDSYSKIELKMRPYSHFINNKKTMVEIVSTKDEFVCSTIDYEEYINEFGPDVYNDVPLEIYKSKIYTALDTLGYINDYICRFGNEEELECLTYNQSYGLTITGKKYKVRYEDNVNVLLYLFHFPFYGS